MLQALHNGKKYCDVVGQPSGLVGEEVLVIFDAGNVFLSCTANRGVLRGEPVLVGKHWDTREREFTPDAGDQATEAADPKAED